MKVSFPDTIQGIRQGLHLLEVHVPVGTVDRTITVETQGPLEPRDTQGGPAGGTYTIAVGIERLHVPLRVTQDGAAEAEVIVRCTAGPEEGAESRHAVNLTAPPAATAGARSGRGTRLALTGLLLAGLAVGGVVIAPRLLGGAKVPSVVAKSEQDAVRELTENKYAIDRTYEDVTDPTKIGSVLATRPGPGERLEEGSKVVLVLGRAAKKPVIPNVLGAQEADARAALEAESLRADVRYVPPTSPDQVGRVVKQLPAATTEVDAGSGVVLRVARAGAPPVAGGTDQTASTQPSTHPTTHPTTHPSVQPGTGPDPSGVVAEGAGVEGPDGGLPLGTDLESVLPQDMLPSGVQPTATAPGDPDAPLPVPTEVRVPGGGADPMTVVPTPSAGTEGSTEPRVADGPATTNGSDQPTPGAGDPLAGDPLTRDPSGDEPSTAATDPLAGAGDSGPSDPILDGPNGLPGAPAPSTAGTGTSGTARPDDGKVEVPDLRGLSEAEAIKVLDGLGLFFFARLEAAPTEAEVGHVMGHEPSAGERVAVSGSIRVKIGIRDGATRPAGESGPAPTPGPDDPAPTSADPLRGTDPLRGGDTTPAALPVAVPALIGFDVDEATEALRQLGFGVRLEKEPTGDVPAGQVLSHEPSAGMRLERGGEVTLVVASQPVNTGTPGSPASVPGPRPGEGSPATPATVPTSRERVIVPGTMGKLEAEAIALVREAGLEVSIRRVDRGDDLYIGRVVNQNPPRGQSVNRGSLVALRIYVPAGTPEGDAPSSTVPSSTGPQVPTPGETPEERPVEPAGDNDPIAPTTAAPDEGGPGEEGPGMVPSRPRSGDPLAGAGAVDGEIGPRAPSAFDDVPDLGTPPSLAKPGETPGHAVAPELAPPPRVVFNQNQVAVPPVQNQAIWDAIDGVLRAGLTPLVELDLKDLEFLDRVAKQTPAAGESARTGDLVRLRAGMVGANMDEALYDMRSFLGAQVDAVRSVYEQAGIRVLVIPVKVPKHPYAGTGRLAAQYPLGRVPVSRARTVTLWTITR